MKMRIQDTLEKIIDNRGKTPPVEETGHCLLEINAIASSGKYPDYSVVKKHVSDDTYNNWFRAGHPMPGDVLIPTVGTLDAIGMMDRSDCCIAQNMIAFRTNPEICDGEFLYYLLCDPLIRRRLLNLDIGGVQPSIKVPHLKNLEVEIPGVDLQKRIVSILRDLDQKIYTNEKINRNLQEQAQAIYIERFVTNADDNWTDGKLSDLIIVKYGKDHKKLADGEIPCYGSGGIMRFVETSLFDQESVLVPRKGTLNNVMYINEPFWSVDTMFYTMMKVPNVAKFVFHFLKGKDLAAMNAGSAVPSMTTDILNAMELKIPSDVALQQFEKDVSPLYIAMRKNEQENECLGLVRNTLLPKLMSGEMDVSDIDL